MLCPQCRVGAAPCSNSVFGEELDHASAGPRRSGQLRNTHEYWRMGSGTLLDELCWDRTPVDRMAQYHHDQQAHRITRAASPLWLQQAQQALGDQKAAYEANADQFVMERG